MTGEAFTLRHFALQRHDSMYLLLPVVMVFLYRLLLAWSPQAPAFCRPVSTWVYILHPAMIVVIRGAAEAVGLTAVLVDNSLVHYLAVCLLSFLAAAVIAWALARLRPPRPTAAGPGFNWTRMRWPTMCRHCAPCFPPGCQLMPAVKANAYGHGALPIARALAAQGISAFCVACLEEGIQLRKGGHPREILILGYTPLARSPCCAGTNSPKPQWISPTPCSSAKPANPCRSTWPLTPGCTAWVSPAITWRRSFKSSP